MKSCDRIISHHRIDASKQRAESQVLAGSLPAQLYVFGQKLFGIDTLVHTAFTECGTSIAYSGNRVHTIHNPTELTGMCGHYEL